MNERVLTTGRLPKKTIDKIKGLADENKENKHVFSSKDIVELVTILDSDPDENVCDLFDGNTFLAVLQILLLSEWCRAAERGLYLLMVSLITASIWMPKTNPSSLLFTKKRAQQRVPQPGLR